MTRNRHHMALPEGQHRANVQMIRARQSIRASGGMLVCGALALMIWLAGSSSAFASATKPVILRSPEGVEAEFTHGEHGYWWTGFRDPKARRAWPVRGARLSIEIDGLHRIQFENAAFESLAVAKGQITLSTAPSGTGLELRQVFSFCNDSRTLRVQTYLRARGETVLVQRVGLLELEVPGENFRLMGPELVSSPVFGDSLFAGIEHPSALCRAKGSTFALSQPVHLRVGREWVALSAAVLGCCREADRLGLSKEGVRRAFLRYLDTVRVKPRDLHVHYNDWWTAPVPSSQDFVLRNLGELKHGLFDPTGFFFDSYALDAGWSNPKSAWEVDERQFSQRFGPIRTALEAMHSHVGLWISPSSLYPFALDNHWLKSAGYEVAPHSQLGFTACLAKGGKYQTAFKNAALAYAREAQLAHMKFDGFVPRCDEPSHGHPVGVDSYLPVAEGLMDVFDALRAQNPAMALEPTCFGYQPSPWWLMHVPFIIGPFGDDSPFGRCPAPDYLESMTTAREIKILTGRNDFLMPSSALQCFDIIMQCPGAFQNHAAMAVGRGRWFVSSYINPKFMDAEAWQFFAGLMRWGRYHREFLQEPVPFGGDPAQRQAYGYAFLGQNRQVYCLRNPWIQEASLRLLRPFLTRQNLELRRLYPRREALARIRATAELPEIKLGPYETQFVEIVPTRERPTPAAKRTEPSIQWSLNGEPAMECVVFDADPPAFGPSWSSPDGAATNQITFTAEGRLTIRQVSTAQLCVLCEGDPRVAENSCRITVDGKTMDLKVSQTKGAFGASGEGLLEHWKWFLAELQPGEHAVRIEITGPALNVPLGVFVRGDLAAMPTVAPFDKGPTFPLYRPDRVTWSRVLVPLARHEPDTAHIRHTSRRIERINGVYLDTLDWSEASAGWGKVQRNRSIMGEAMTLGGQTFLRGIGAHALSRIRYSLPEGFTTFQATIGKDQEVSGGSVVFVVEADGREVFRSGVFRNDTPPQPITVPLAGVRTLGLVVEDSGNDIMADHADWADARLLK